MSKRNLTLYHGTSTVIKHPLFSYCKSANDYGTAFYCTDDLVQGKRWTSGVTNITHKGIVNEYCLPLDGLKMFDFADGKTHVLNWLATIVQNRLPQGLSQEAKKDADYLIENFAIDLRSFDIVRGYRADDAYFRYVSQFLDDDLSLDALNEAMYLGTLGEQYAVMIQETMDKMQFKRFLKSSTKDYEDKQKDASKAISKMSTLKRSWRKGLHIADIVDEGVKDDDVRLSKFLCRHSGR